VPRERLELAKNPAYWDSKRVPKIDKVVMLPMPEANARTAALLSGQVDWIEAPAPDAIAQIKSRGFDVYANAQPHMWPWQLSFAPNSPWLDKRVRQAANLCVNRAGLKTLLGGYMAEAKGIVEAGNPWWGNPAFTSSTTRGRAQADDRGRLLGRQAGEGKGPGIRIGLRPDAAAADERVRTAEPQGVLLRRGL
jgi:ABC-type transport system substrate-binding protein